MSSFSRSKGIALDFPTVFGQEIVTSIRDNVNGDRVSLFIAINGDVVILCENDDDWYMNVDRLVDVDSSQARDEYVLKLIADRMVR